MSNGGSNRDKYLHIEPDTSMVRKTRYVNLSIAEAIGELVANSFDERVTLSQKMRIEIEIPGEGKGGVLRVIDNGRGMDRDGLENALRLGKSDKAEGQKGMFGIGLKTAGAVIGGSLSIETAQSASDFALRADFDFERLEEWKVPYEQFPRGRSEFFKNSTTNGTVVEISGLRKTSFHIQPIISFLSLAFKHHLLDGDTIIINGDPLQPREFVFIEGTKEDIEIPVGDHTIRGWAGLLVTGSVKSDFQTGLTFGVNIYRNKQLIAAFYKGFLPRAHPDYGRVIGELHIDFVDVNYTKKGINFTNPNWSEVERRVSGYLKKFASASMMTHRSSSKKWGKGKLQQADWQDLDIERLEIEAKTDKRKAEVLARAKKMFKALGKPIEDEGKKESADGDEDSEEDEDIVPSEDEKLIELIGENKVRLAGKEITFDFLYITDDESPWQWHQRSVDKDRIVVFLNESFGLLRSTESHEGRKIICTLALAEELRDYLIGLGADSIQTQKDVFDWVNRNYDRILVPKKNE